MNKWIKTAGLYGILLASFSLAGCQTQTPVKTFEIAQSSGNCNMSETYRCWLYHEQGKDMEWAFLYEPIENFDYSSRQTMQIRMEPFNNALIEPSTPMQNKSFTRWIKE